MSGGTNRWTLAAAIAAALFAAPTLRAAGACAREPVPTVVNSQAPADVCIPPNFTDVATDYFDDYSWRAFVALVWPAALERRGMPDPSKKLGDDGPRVFETYKALWEVFHQDGSPPA